MAFFVVNPAAEFVTKICWDTREGAFPSAVVRVSKEVTTGSAYKMNSEQGFFRLTGFVVMEGLWLLLRM